MERLKIQYVNIMNIYILRMNIFLQMRTYLFYIQ